MLKKNVVVEEEPGHAITPDGVSRVNQVDMKPAVVEHFKGSADLVALKSKKRSPYWQPADDQC